MRLVRRLLAVASATAIVLTVSATPAGAIVGGSWSTRHDGLAVIRHNGNAICTGSIIDNYWILTAKHCLYEGADWSNPRMANSAITVRVKSHETHSGGGIVQVATSRVRTNHDIALLKLDRSANAQPVRLATKAPQLGATLVVYGYGTGLGDGYPMSNLLKRAEMINASNYSTDLAGGQAIEAYMGYNDGGTPCDGDSGGPLFKVVDGSRYQVGVTARTVAPYCTDRARFSSVPASLDWINNVMATV